MKNITIYTTNEAVSFDESKVVASRFTNLTKEQDISIGLLPVFDDTLMAVNPEGFNIFKVAVQQRADIDENVMERMVEEALEDPTIEINQENFEAVQDRVRAEVLSMLKATAKISFNTYTVIYDQEDKVMYTDGSRAKSDVYIPHILRLIEGDSEFRLFEYESGIGEKLLTNWVVAGETCRDDSEEEEIKALDIPEALFDMTDELVVFGLSTPLGVNPKSKPMINIKGDGFTCESAQKAIDNMRKVRKISLDWHDKIQMVLDSTGAITNVKFAKELQFEENPDFSEALNFINYHLGFVYVIQGMIRRLRYELDNTKL
ncbi:recombination-associated protein [Pseudoalteromonas phage J2-1_QLiu-2017]|nr:recombination-associated protein [Pseudoalteromonas phage J2-1_QLiu-2017]